MKKISRLFFSVASAALISLSLFACSEPASDDIPSDSIPNDLPIADDNPSAPFDSIPENPPASVGEDPFKGKTIASGGNKYIFSTDGTCENAHNITYKYSYNTEKKELYLLAQSYDYNGKTLTSAQEYFDLCKDYYDMFPDFYLQADASLAWCLRTYSYEISGSSVTLNAKPEVGLVRFESDISDEGCQVQLYGNAINICYGSSSNLQILKASINKNNKKISCNKTWFSVKGEEESCNFVATYTENGDRTITLKVLEKSDNMLCPVPDTLVLKCSDPLDGTYTIE